MMKDNSSDKSALRKRANEIKDFTCKNLIVVLENPKTLKNIGSVVRNVNALGAEKVYIVDEAGLYPMIGKICVTGIRLLSHLPLQLNGVSLKGLSQPNPVLST